MSVERLPGLIEYAGFSIHVHAATLPSRRLYKGCHSIRLESIIQTEVLCSLVVYRRLMKAEAHDNTQ